MNFYFTVFQLFQDATVVTCLLLNGSIVFACMYMRGGLTFSIILVMSVGVSSIPISKLNKLFVDTYYDHISGCVYEWELDIVFVALISGWIFLFLLIMIFIAVLDGLLESISTFLIIVLDMFYEMYFPVLRFLAALVTFLIQFLCWCGYPVMD